MKLGIECEGRLKGIVTLFADASTPLPDIKRAAAHSGIIQHIYISDNDNTLDYAEVGECFNDSYVTLDVTKVKGKRPRNISLMFRVTENWSFDDITQLTEYDQVKFESNRHVVVFPMTASIKTKPEDFEGDKEL